ncbi:MAG: hypothetical protein HYT93_01165 [Parcubacteria group bacterium]|nr:hypothetical protein [Parcubacteria group bacterium]
MKTLTFKPKQVTKNLLLVLPERAQDVVESRFGLGKDPKKRTLESIGDTYNITRERVRQIENFALNSIRKSDAYKNEQDAFTELHNLLDALGGVVAEEDLLEHLAPENRGLQNHFHLLLVLGEPFEKKREDAHFKHRWVQNEETSQHVHRALHDLYKNLKEDDLVAENEIIDMFVSRLKEVEERHRKDEETLRRWLNISKVIQRNPLGEWGLASSPNIRARGARDYAYLVIRRHGSPLHFTEVAKEITKLFGKSAHTATCHNELIKDKDRFVLVGRGIYGLAEWGYTNGIVRDVIRDILQEHGSLHKDDLVEKVLKERYVKENTVLVNLQNKKYFKKDDNDMYTVA